MSLLDKETGYYKTMFLDGFTPYEILAAARQSAYDQFVNKDDDEETVIIIKG